MIGLRMYTNRNILAILFWTCVDLEAVGEEILSKTEHYNKTIGINVESEIKSYDVGQYIFMRQIP